MDINQMRAAVTVLSLFCFIGLVFWVWASHRRAAFDEAARLPFLDDEANDSPGAQI
jgi:cytochrome c oxidase cbb3-type subunit 4